MSEERFGKHMKLLIDTGVVQKERQRSGNRYGRNLYTLTQSPDFQSTENQGIEKPGIEKQGLEDPGSKNISSNINRSKNNSIEEYSVRVCELLNQAKEKVNSKGRLRPNTWAVQDLIRQGLTIQDIEEAATDLACTGADVTWSSFAKHCKDKRRK